MFSAGPEKLRENKSSNIITRKVLDERCALHRLLINCINDKIEDCMDKNKQIILKKTYAGFTKIVQGRCTRKFQDEYLKHGDCLAKLIIDKECYKDAPVRRYDEFDIIYSYAYYPTVCGAFQKFSSCANEMAQKSCGNESVWLISAYLKLQAVHLWDVCFENPSQELGLPDKATSTDHSVLLIFMGILSSLYYFILELASN